MDGGKIQLVLSFEAPEGVAFPRDQTTVTSYVLGQRDTITKHRKTVPDEIDDGTFSDEAVRKAFDFFDLDKNGYLGVAELRHILIMMGEHVSDEEVDLMISMLDLNGDGPFPPLPAASSLLYYLIPFPSRPAPAQGKSASKSSRQWPSLQTRPKKTSCGAEK